MEQLSIKNAHRAKTVRIITDPELGVLPFGFRAEKTGFQHYSHTAGDGESRVTITDQDLPDWEIVEFTYDVTLAEYWDLAQRAFSWTSFSPDVRGRQTIIEHERELNGDLENIPAEEQERYISNYKKYFSSWLSAHSNCASSAITGGSGFNTRRAEKMNNRERARVEEFRQWREKALKAIAKRKEEAKPEEVKNNEAWEKLRSDIIRTATTIHEINTGANRYSSKPLFVSNLYGRVETYARQGNVELVDKAVELMREMNQKLSTIITERHKFFHLPEVAREISAKMEALATKENKEKTFNGGVVVWNYAENRLQIIFASKPEPDMIAALKKAAFKWTPRFGAWQRQLTRNAEIAAGNVLNGLY